MSRNNLFRILILGVLFMLFVPTAVHAQITITFDELEQNDQVGTLDGVVFGSAWYAAVDSDAGGSGDASVANEPTPSTGAFLTSGGALDRRITFPRPVKTVRFFYSLDTTEGTPVVTFYSSSDTLLGTASMDVCGSSNCGSECAGDPEGLLCAWTELTFTSSSSYISYMEFSADAFFSYIIDNLTLQNPLNRNGFWAPPSQIGGAIVIDIRGNNLAVGWGAYDKDTGEPSWMYSDGQMTDTNHYIGPLWKFAQGQCFNCPYIAGPKVQQQMGDITITFQDDTTAIMNAMGITKIFEKVE